MCFVGAAYGNDPTKRIYATRFHSSFSEGAVVYRSKTQSINALVFTETEHIDDVTDDNTDRFLRSVLWELGFTQEYTSPFYEYNDTTINIVNSIITTERTRHIGVRFFVIQSWKEAGDIIMHHIPGIINPADDVNKPIGRVL